MIQQISPGLKRIWQTCSFILYCSFARKRLI